MATATKLDELQAKAVILYKKDETTAQAFGEALIAVRSEMKATKHGKFTEWLRESGIKTARANYCMQLVEGKRKGKQSEPKRDAAYQPMLFVEDAFEEMLKAAKDGNVDVAKKLADDINAELERVREAVKMYMHQASEVQKFNAKKPVVDVFRQPVPEMATAHA